jgi:hypothetical protein
MLPSFLAFAWKLVVALGSSMHMHANMPLHCLFSLMSVVCVCVCVCLVLTTIMLSGAEMTSDPAHVSSWGRSYQRPAIHVISPAAHARIELPSQDKTYRSSSRTTAEDLLLSAGNLNLNLP